MDFPPKTNLNICLDGLLIVMKELTAVPPLSWPSDSTLKEDIMLKRRVSVILTIPYESIEIS